MMFNNLSPSRVAIDLLADAEDGVVVTMPVKMLSMADVMVGAAVGMLTGTMTSLEAMTIPA